MTVLVEHFGRSMRKKNIDLVARPFGLLLQSSLSQPWILDADVTVKTLYGKQEGAVVGYIS